MLNDSRSFCFGHIPSNLRDFQILLLCKLADYHLLRGVHSMGTNHKMEVEKSLKGKWNLAQVHQTWHSNTKLSADRPEVAILVLAEMFAASGEMNDLSQQGFRFFFGLSIFVGTRQTSSHAVMTKPTKVETILHWAKKVDLKLHTGLTIAKNRLAALKPILKIYFLSSLDSDLNSTYSLTSVRSFQPVTQNKKRHLVWDDMTLSFKRIISCFQSNFGNISDYLSLHGF